MTTFAALGDSITLGVGDPVPSDGSRAWRGWAALLAEGLHEPRLHILASCGARIPDVERDQLAAALQLRPVVFRFVVGVNDTLRANFDIAQAGAAAAHTVGALRAAGAEVLTMRLPDPGQMLALPGSLARPPARRVHEVNPMLEGSPSGSARCTTTRPGTPRSTIRGCGRWTGCIPASAATG